MHMHVLIYLSTLPVVNTGSRVKYTMIPQVPLCVWGGGGIMIAHTQNSAFADSMHASLVTTSI